MTCLLLTSMWRLWFCTLWVPGITGPGPLVYLVSSIKENPLTYSLMFSEQTASIGTYDIPIDSEFHVDGCMKPKTQCSILLVTRVVFNFITERGKERENLFLLQVYMLAVPRIVTLDHQVFYKIFRILCNCLFSKEMIQFFQLLLIKVVQVW